MDRSYAYRPPSPSTQLTPLHNPHTTHIQVLPLIQRCFSREEMARLVGTILGERPGDLMDTILAMMFRCVFRVLCVFDVAKNQDVRNLKC